MKLSERLGIHAQDVAQASQPDDDMVLGYHQLNDLAEALREATEIVRRVEEAPVRSVIHQHIKGDEWEALAFQLDDFLPAMIGKRVRIVLDKEG